MVFGFFLFLWLLRCFTSPGLLLTRFLEWVFRYYSEWVPPLGNPRIKGCLPPPRGFSQVATSVVDQECQGIHRTLFKMRTTETHNSASLFYAYFTYNVNCNDQSIQSDAIVPFLGLEMNVIWCPRKRRKFGVEKNRFQAASKSKSLVQRNHCELVYIVLVY